MRDNIGMPHVGGDVTEGAATVLIVEDSESSAAVLEIALLGLANVSVRLVGSALEALRVLRGPGAAIRAIVTDLNMPRMDGFELIRAIREDRALAATPIIVISADTDPATPGRVARLGVSAYFSKPFSPAQVCRKLEQILNGTTE